jgi:hypothetical protein
MEDDLRRYWEEKAAWRQKEWERDWGQNYTTGPLVYLRDVVPYKHIVRNIRLKAGEPICWGATDCLDQPVSQCAADKHETCEKHKDTCYLCKV